MKNETRTPSNTICHGILQASILGPVAIPSQGDLPDLEIEPCFPALQADSLPSAPPEAEVNSNVRLSASWEAAGTVNVQELRTIPRIVPLKSLRNYRETWRLMQRA